MRKAIVAMKEKVVATNRYAEGLVRARDEGNARLVQAGQEPVSFPTWKIYFHAYLRDYGGLIGVEDVSVIKDGRTLDGHDAGVLDYTFAGVGAFLPFVSGSAIKNVAKKLRIVKQTEKASDNAIQLKKLLSDPSNSSYRNSLDLHLLFGQIIQARKPSF